MNGVLFTSFRASVKRKSFFSDSVFFHKFEDFAVLFYNHEICTIYVIMGGVVSAGRDNDELIDNLCKGGYIITPEVERVFRILDRKSYMVFRDEDDATQAYEDHAWKRGNYHLSAPCIYTKALESLDIKRGQSFLNLGSGTGYLSTMAGLLLGAKGINHGIEIFKDNVEFAYENLNKFKQESPWYDPVEFCDPSFIVGNALLLSSDGMMYDKVYCGAACPTEHVHLLKSMLNVGGVLILPCESTLEAVTRIGECEWDQSVILSTVSFAPLILPSAVTPDDLAAITMVTEVQSLKELSRLAILSSLKRSRYHEIISLPLPNHLIQHVLYNRSWEPLPAPLKKLCPIDEAERQAMQKNDEAKGISEGGFGIGWDSLPNGGLLMQRVGGQNMLQVNLNGVFFQVAVESESDESDSDHDLNESSDCSESELEEEQKSESETTDKELEQKSESETTDDSDQ